jgi:hypothetical protein
MKACMCAQPSEALKSRRIAENVHYSSCNVPLVTSLSRKESGTWLSGNGCRIYKAILHFN